MVFTGQRILKKVSISVYIFELFIEKSSMLLFMLLVSYVMSTKIHQYNSCLISYGEKILIVLFIQCYSSDSTRLASEKNQSIVC